MDVIWQLTWYKLWESGTEGRRRWEQLTHIPCDYMTTNHFILAQLFINGLKCNRFTSPPPLTLPSPLRHTAFSNLKFILYNLKFKWAVHVPRLYGQILLSFVFVYGGVEGVTLWWALSGSLVKPLHIALRSVMHTIQLTTICSFGSCKHYFI